MDTVFLRRLRTVALTLALPIAAMMALTSCHGHAGHEGHGPDAEPHTRNDGGSDPGFESQRPNSLSKDERAAGWALLFDGRTTAGWRGYQQQELPGGWSVESGALARGDGGGDIISIGQFQDFELRLQWKIGPAGNSGH